MTDSIFISKTPLSRNNKPMDKMYKYWGNSLVTLFNIAFKAHEFIFSIILHPHDINNKHLLNVHYINCMAPVSHTLRCLPHMSAFSPDGDILYEAQKGF